jgi:hypothetical protein
MRLRFAFLGLAVVTLAGAAALVACSSSDKPAPPPLIVTEDDAAAADSAPPPVEQDAAPPPIVDASTVGTIYVHTGKTLFLFEPYGKTLKKIGDFSCLTTDAYYDEVGDIAVNRDGEIYGTTLDDRFIKIDPNTAACTQISKDVGGYPNSLSFVPRGTLDPANDALVGYFGDEYVRIDVTTGKITTIGQLNPPDASTTYESSGDVVSVGADRTYLSAKTLKGGITQDAGDVIVRFDPKTGQRIAVAGNNTNRANIYGMGYWAGTAYGFTAKGEALSIDPQTGTATLVPLDAGGAKSNQGVFYGAGSTTVAPTR